MTIAEYNELRREIEKLLGDRLSVSASAHRSANEILDLLYEHKAVAIDPTSSMFRMALIFCVVRRYADRELFDLVDNWVVEQGLATGPLLEPQTAVSEELDAYLKRLLDVPVPGIGHWHDDTTNNYE